MRYDQFAVFEHFIRMLKQSVELYCHAAPEFVFLIRKFDFDGAAKNPAHLVIIPVELRPRHLRSGFGDGMHAAHIPVTHALKVEISGLVMFFGNDMRRPVFRK